MKQLFLSLLLTALGASFVYAAADAESTLREGMDEALAIVEHSPSGKVLADKLQPSLEKRVSFEAMTRRAVGPGWKKFTPAQQQEATKLFTKLIVHSYCDKFTPGAKTSVEYRKSSSPAADKVEVPTVMTYKGGRYNIVYRLENHGRWVITDILAEGVSLVANYRAQFDELYKKGGADAVLNSLQQSVARNS